MEKNLKVKGDYQEGKKKRCLYFKTTKIDSNSKQLCSLNNTK